MIESSEMTNAEYLRLNGALSLERMHEMVRLEEESGFLASAAESAKVYVQEGMTQFPAEDFLENIKQRLIDLQKSTRGSNREALAGIIESLDDLAQTTFYAADYGRSELHNALRALDGKDAVKSHKKTK